jgi:hypothetical protein
LELVVDPLLILERWVYMSTLMSHWCKLAHQTLLLNHMIQCQPNMMGLQLQSFNCFYLLSLENLKCWTMSWITIEWIIIIS